MQTIRGCSFLFQLMKRNKPKQILSIEAIDTMLACALCQPHEMVCAAQTMEMVCTPAVLMSLRALSAAFANSQQILKQVQDD